MKLFMFQKLYNDPDGFNYGVHFSRDREAFRHFSRYSSAMGEINNKKFDKGHDWWKITEEDYRKLLLVEESVCGKKEKPSWISSLKRQKKEEEIEEEPKLGAVPKQSVSGYDSMGTWMKLQPYGYQKEIIKFCLDKETSLIVSPCGSGKTAVAIALFGEALGRKKIKGPGMIIVKASLKVQWLSEIGKFSEFDATIVQTLAQLGKNREKFEAQFSEDKDLYILNYEALRDNDIRNHMHKLRPDFIFCDEIHYCKDDNTKRAKAVCEFSDAKFRIGATATPVQKNPLDIFGLFKFIDPTLFPKKGEFGNKYVRWTNFGGYVRRPIGSRNEAELNRKIAPYMIVKTKEEVSAQLPKLMVLQRSCQFTDKQQKKSDELKAILADLHEQEKSISIKLNKIGAKTSDELKQCEAKIMMYQTFAQELADDEELLAMSTSEHAIEFMTGDGSAKTDMAIELVKEIIDSGEKVAIFSRYARYQEILTKRIKAEKELKGINIAYVNGTISDKKRYIEVYEKFRDNDDYKILLMSDSGAEGLNLSTCQYIIEMDLANSFAIQTQRHGRIERADSTHDTVYVYQLMTEKSYDDVAAKIVSKKEYFDSSIIKGDML